ncbi:hypothetical protein ABH931_002284 [Streptacidiphilus sp. MAP12-33]|uniref:hypothetical protein n=1 Tax=Streptacidiphilus sp. MAP12-33 TaxID=3156266 RepID=UPI0035112C89
MKLGKLVAKGVAEDVLDGGVEEPRPVSEPGTVEADTARPAPMEPVTAGSSTQR